MQTLYCKLVLQVKGDFSKFLEELLFGTYHARVEFLDRAQKFLLLHLNMIPPKTNFKILETNKGNICGGVSFRIVIDGWIGQFKFFKRNATKDIFQRFPNGHKLSN